MKTARAEEDPQLEPDLLPEYDFSGGVRGKYAEAMRRGYSVVVHHEDGTTETTFFPGEEGVELASASASRQSK